MMKLLLLISLIMIGAEAGDILIYPYGHCLNSHLLNAEKLAAMLLDQGHQVTMVMSDMYQDFQHQQYEFVDSRINLATFDAPKNYTPICDYDTVDFMMHSPLNKRFNAFIHTSVKYCDQLLSDRSLLKSLKSHGYDVLIIESLDPCSRILADYIDIPFIPLMTTGLGHFDGNPRLPSYLPAAIAPFTNKMTFSQRIGNFIMKFMYDTIPIVMGFETPFEELKMKYDLNTSLSISTTYNRASVKFINSDFAIEYPAPVDPDSILIGGFAVNEPKPLSPELESWMNNAGPAGVIVMSMGTLVKRFDAKWTALFLDAFARLPQRVIWRYYDAVNATNTPLIIPDNVRLEKWLPQRDLLAHGNTRAFITHCGLNSMFEAAYSGVPVVALPMSGDHFNNAAKLVDHAGMGVKVDMFSVTSQDLYEAIQAVVSKPEFTHKAKAMAARIKDQPISIPQKINYWVQYVIRHNGVPHLKPSSRDMSSIEYFSLDVIAAILGLTVCIVSLLLGLLWCAVYSLKRHLKVVNMDKKKLE